MNKDSKLSAWGDSETKYFYELSPERILDAVETSGLSCTGRCLALNSMENRVYEVEIEVDEQQIKSPSERFRIVKFYRPARWSKEQILEEHQLLLDLVELEIPVVAPLKLDNGETLHKVPNCDIWFAIFPKVGGKNPDELNNAQLSIIGRLLGRMHNVGAVKDAPHRIRLNPETYGIENLNYLLESQSLPLHLENRYADLVEEICDISEPWFAEAEIQRIHGDCHLGNLLWGPSGPFWVDFDDMLVGPCIQDLWLIIPGRDDFSKRQLEVLINAYSEMKDFDPRTLRLIEPLRALRMIHFSAWIAKRWGDQAFKNTFVAFGTELYWSEQLRDLEEQLNLIQGSY